jgi:hypothetical protein
MTRDDIGRIKITTTKEFGIYVKAGRVVIQNPASLKIEDITAELKEAGSFDGAVLSNVNVGVPENSI